MQARMKPGCFLSLFLVLFFIACPALAAEKHCDDVAMTQRDINICTDRQARKARAEMNRELETIRKLIANRPKKLQALEKAQKSWEDYVHDQVVFLYFDHGGSAAPMCDNIAYESFIRERTKELKDWVKYSSDNICGAQLYYYADPEPEPDPH